MDPLDIPPLIVVYGDGSYIISDGNNRHEAMRRKGWLKCWVLIWHNSSPEFEASQRLLQTLVLGPSQASLGNPMISQAAPNR